MAEVLAYSELPTTSARESHKMQCVAARRQSNRKLKTENLDPVSSEKHKDSYQ